MRIILASPAAVLRKGVPDVDVISALRDIRAAGNPVGLVSNRKQPDWFEDAFKNSGVQFLDGAGRQDGKVIAINAKKFKLEPYDALVLAAKPEDIQMAKNGGGIIMAAGWSDDSQVQSLGIRVDSAAQLREVVQLSQAWTGDWWYRSDHADYKVRALMDLSQYGKDASTQAFAGKLTAVVKNGGTSLTALLTVTARSLLKDGVASQDGLVWGVYPSSSSDNDDTDVLCDFTHRLRTTVSRVRFAKRGEPLFVRHTASAKRSSGAGGLRTDPTDQLTTVHLNPFYAASGRLAGKHVVVIDDCTTYGVSFAVSSALLRTAGAASVTAIAVGKFGNQLRRYGIELNANPFKPIPATAIALAGNTLDPGTTNAAAQAALKAIIP